MTEKRHYVKRLRAEQQDETRLRIVRAAVQLHEELGPRNTTIKAVAERAGVQRLTVYRHFENDAALFAACTAHWLQANPPPDPELWRDVVDPASRARAALLAFGGYYRRTAAMWAASYRDVSEVAALQAPMAAVERHLDTIAADLIEQWPKRSRTIGLRATVRHCLRYATWDSMTRAAPLSDGAFAQTCVRWIEASAGAD